MINNFHELDQKTKNLNSFEKYKLWERFIIWQHAKKRISYRIKEKISNSLLRRLNAQHGIY